MDKADYIDRGRRAAQAGDPNFDFSLGQNDHAGAAISSIMSILWWAESHGANVETIIFDAMESWNDERMALERDAGEI